MPTHALIWTSVALTILTVFSQDYARNGVPIAAGAPSRTGETGSYAKTAPQKVPFAVLGGRREPGSLDDGYFLAASPLAGSGFAAAVADAPGVTVSSDSHFPPFTIYMVIGPFLRSPFSSKAIGPITPW